MYNHIKWLIYASQWLIKLHNIRLMHTFHVHMYITLTNATYIRSHININVCLYSYISSEKNCMYGNGFKVISQQNATCQMYDQRTNNTGNIKTILGTFPQNFGLKIAKKEKELHRLQIGQYPFNPFSNHPTSKTECCNTTEISCCWLLACAILLATCGPFAMCQQLFYLPMVLII